MSNNNNNNNNNLGNMNYNELAKRYIEAGTFMEIEKIKQAWVNRKMEYDYKDKIYRIKKQTQKLLDEYFVSPSHKRKIMQDYVENIKKLEIDAKESLDRYSDRLIKERWGKMFEVNNKDFSNVNKPALFYFSMQDKVVNPQKIKKFISGWGGKRTITIVKLSKDDDKYSHVLAGSIISPNQTQQARKTMVNWIESLN